MALQIEETENKKVELKSSLKVGGTDIGQITATISDYQHDNISVHLEIYNHQKKAYIENKESVEKDITDFVTNVFAKTQELLGGLKDETNK